MFAKTYKNNEFLLICRQYNELLQLVQDLYKLGFRVISHEPNMVVGPDPEDGFYHFVEVVFMKEM